MLAGLATLLAAGTAVAAQPLEVRRSVIDVDRRVVVLDVRCTGRRCAGLLQARAIIKSAPISAGRRVRLRSGRTRRVTLRLLPDGLHRFSHGGGEVGTATLRVSARVIHTADIYPHVRASCRSGDTLAATGLVRVFRVVGFGAYACELPGGKPFSLRADPRASPWGALGGLGNLRVAGPYVALVSGFSWKCSSTWVAVFDVRTRREVRRQPSAETIESHANACTSTSSVQALVLRPTGAIAWADAPGDEGAAAIRVADAAGERLLDRGPDVDPASLVALDDDRIGWTRGGQPREAPLR